MLISFRAPRHEPGARAPSRFGPRDQHGLILGLRAGQIGILLCGVLLALGAVTASQAHPLAILAVLALAVLSGAAALMPVGGRGVDEWVPVG